MPEKDMKIIAPIVPEHGLIWEGFPLFHAGDFSSEFSGKLFFVLGQGLGDHLNGFRVIHEIGLRFPKARLIVYADLRWEELVRRIGKIEIRWFPKALEVRSKEGTNDPYAVAHSEIRSEMDSSPGSSYLAYAHFPMPDRYARGESTIQSTMRAIALPLGESFRPYFPVLSDDLAWADRYLERNALQAGCFAVIAPFTWPNKRWPKEHFSEIIDKLRDFFGLRSVIIAYPEMGEFQNEGVLCAYDLSLGQIGGLLARGGMYLGLDSGLSHLAAALDLPAVEIFVEKKVIPFEVRAHSPLFLYNIDGFFHEQKLPSTDSVFATLSFAWENRNTLSDSLPLCPACFRKAQYISGNPDGIMRFMCVCGTSLEIPIRQQERTVTFSEEHAENLPIISARKNTRLELGIYSDLSARANILGWERILAENSDIEQVKVSFDQPLESLRGETSLTPYSRIQWSMDGVLFWMNGMGYRAVSLEKSRVLAGRKTLLSLCFVRTGTIEDQQDQGIAIPWGGVSLNLRSIDQYLKWYSFERWGKPSDLVGIVKSMSSLGFLGEALESARVAFAADPSFRSFRWLLKTFWFFRSKTS
jgi:hypothetical protein